jgi:hypothetical protein
MRNRNAARYVRRKYRLAIEHPTGKPQEANRTA